MRVRRLVPLSGIVLGLVFALLTTGASAAPSPFSLTFEGAHVSDPTLPSGLRHDGRLTASAPFCSSGRAYDTRQIDNAESLTVWRIHTCDDGSGSFTAFMPNVRGEHGGGGGGGAGRWTIVEGEGRYAQLRGQGTYSSTLVSGDPTDFGTIVYRTEWKGIVDFDADAPAIRSLSATAKKLPTKVRTYTLRLVIRARDASTPISYTVDVRAGGRTLGLKVVSTRTEQAAITLRISPPRSARSVRINLAAADALGNATTASRTIRLAG